MRAAPKPAALEIRDKLPQVRARECAEWRARFELCVPAALGWFEGHFPDHPVLPGVAQIGWAIFFAREAFHFTSDPPSIERAKFHNPIRPEQSLSLELQRDRGYPDRVGWRFEREDAILSRGRLEFVP
jgi:3-hydroxymyristoyl/3-hydroxydecanoyl-(acyl carrier protein) dehydratase